MRLGMGMGLHDLLRRVAAGVAQSTLLQGLISYWPLNEGSGVRYDVVGTNHLTDNNTVGAKLRGPEGTVARFIKANSESLSLGQTGNGGIIHPANYEQEEFAVSFWYKHDLTGWTGDFVNAFMWGANAVSSLHVNDQGRIGYGAIGCYDTVDGWSGGAAFGWGDYGDATSWHHFYLVKSFAGQFASVYVDGALAAHNTTFNHGKILWFGYYPDIILSGRNDGLNKINGLLSKVLFYEAQGADPAARALSLYNGGNGKTYEELSGDDLVGLTASYELDEVSGVRYDSHGSNDLTDNNTTYASNGGPKGTVASFVRANSEKLSHPTLANDLDWSQGVTLLFWHKGINETGKGFASFGTSIYQGQHCFGLNDQGSSNDVLYIQMELGDYAPKLNAVYGVDSPHQSGFFDWHLLGGRYKADTKTGLVSLDANTPAETPALASHPTFAQANKEFRLGSDGISFITGRQSCAGVWNRTLSNAEVAALFNGGVPKRYADLSDAEKVGLVSYWNLNEQSGVRYDSHGTNHLTDNNTVGSIINAGDAMDGAAASFVAANNEYCSRIDTVLPAEFTVSGWFNHRGTIGQAIFGCYDMWPAHVQVMVYNGGGNLIYSLIGDGVTYYYAAAAAPGYPNFQGSGWHHFVTWYDSSDGRIHLVIDNFTPDYVVAIPMIGVPYRDPAPLTIGSGIAALDGEVDEVAIWDRVLTADERAELFNLGKGRYYDFS